MKTQNQILQDLTTDFISEQSKVTYMGKDGTVRGIFKAITNLMFEFWNDLYQTVRRIFPDTSTDVDLDALGARRGLTRNGASKSSCIVIFNGTAGVTFPVNTIINSNLSGVSYKTLSEIITGTANSGLISPIIANSIGDSCLVESLDAGSNAQVDSNELTQLAIPVTGITVTNLVPSIGGADKESDDQFRYRIINQITLLNQGTRKFYETLAMNSEPTISKALPVYNVSSLGTTVYLLKNSFATYTDDELIAIAANIYISQRALSPVNCLNAEILGISVSFQYIRNSGYTAEQNFTELSSNFANYIQSILDFGAVISYKALLEMVIDLPGLKSLKGNSLLLNGGMTDLYCTSTQVPKFVSLTMNDGTAITKSINSTL